MNIKLQAELKGYIVGKTIGKGTFGKVKKAIHKVTQQPVAIKILQKSRIKDITDVERVSRQLHILKIVRHSVIAQLYEVIETATCIYIVMEYAGGGEFFDFVMDSKVTSQQSAFEYFSQIVSALEYLHRLGICHRDVKPENMLMDSHNKIKLVDFGLSNLYKGDEFLKTACGSPCYASPEMIRGEDYDPQLTDVWSLGIVLFTEVMAKLPFEDENTSKLYSKIKSGLYLIDRKISAELKDLIGKLIHVQPERRLRLKEIKSHPWCKKYTKNTKRSINGIEIGFEDIPIDMQIVSQMEKMGSPKEEIIKYLSGNVKNQITTTYYLFLKKNFKYGRSSAFDICSDNYLIKMPNARLSVRERRHKSFDLAVILQKQHREYSKTKHNNKQYPSKPCRYSSMHNIELEKAEVQRKISRAVKAKSSNYENFLKVKAQSETKLRNFTTDFIRKNPSVSYEKSEKQKKQQKRRFSVSHKTQTIYSPKRTNIRLNTESGAAKVYRTAKNNSEKVQVKNGYKRPQIDLTDNTFWRKKSIASKKSISKPIIYRSVNYDRENFGGQKI